jgi:hypothetical protein
MQPLTVLSGFQTLCPWPLQVGISSSSVGRNWERRIQKAVVTGFRNFLELLQIAPLHGIICQCLSPVLEVLGDIISRTAGIRSMS